MKVQRYQIEKVIELAAKHKQKAPELLELLGAIVLLEELEVPLRRNQEFVMKAVIQHFDALLYIRDLPPERK